MRGYEGSFPASFMIAFRCRIIAARSSLLSFGHKKMKKAKVCSKVSVGNHTNLCAKLCKKPPEHLRGLPFPNRSSSNNNYR